MRYKFSWGQLKKSGLILILLIVAVNLPAIAQTGQQEAQIFPHVVVIEVTPNSGNGMEQSTGIYNTDEIEVITSNDHIQETMEVEWGTEDQENEITSPLKFKMNNSVTLINGDSKIAPKYIEVREKGITDEAEYSSLGNWKKLVDWLKIINTEKSSEKELEFRINPKIYDENDWRDIKAGVYEGHIISNVKLTDSYKNKFKIIVIINTYYSVNAPNKLELELEEPIADKSSSVSWSIDTNNSNINVKFESEGIRMSNEDAEKLGVKEDHLDYSKFFKYHIDDKNFTPGNSTEVEGLSGELKLKYTPDKDWNKVTAARYEDKIYITVFSSEN